MSKRTVYIIAAAAVGAGALLATPAWSQEGYQPAARVEIAWNRLYDHGEVVQLCRDLVAAYPEFLRMESIGKSYQGRDMWVVTMNNPNTGADTDKPAMYIDANIHGNEVQGTEVVLYSIWYLTKAHGVVPDLTALIDRASFYFIPMVNPDGRAYWFDQPNTPHSSRGGQLPTDNDGDGLFDEDPPNDLDGDGELLEMRRPNPNGAWRESPDDPRVLVRVSPEARGTFARFDRLGQEGIDDDGDGAVNEDGPGGYDPNRNWPAFWQPNYIQFGAGDYPLSLPESKAIADFILAHPNIAAVQAYHNNGGMILRGPGAREVEYSDRDVRVYDRIGARGEQILPFYKYMVIWKDLYTVYGGFVNWTYEDLGIVSFTNELWSDKQYFATDDANRQQRLVFNDHLLFGQEFVPWKPAQHPVYGEIEVGGWRKMTGRVPPSFHLEELCHRNFAFTVFHAAQMPELSLDELEVAPLANGMWRVRIDVRNQRLIPTTTAQGESRGYGPRDYVEISGDGLRVAAGGTIDDRFTAPFRFARHNPHKLWVDRGVPGEDAVTFQWIVSGGDKARVRFVSPRARDVEMEFPLQPTP